MVEAYIDDSGSHRGSPVCVLGGYFGGVNQWRQFEKSWKAVLSKYRVKEFHAKRFWADNAKEYGEWTKAKKNQFLDELLAIINGNKITPFACGVLGDEWTKLSIEERRLFTGATKKFPSGCPSRSMFLALQRCFLRIADSCNPGAKCHFIFDHDPTIIGWAEICYSQLRQLSFADSVDALPLQAADLIAYEAQRYTIKAKGNPTEPLPDTYKRAILRARSKEDFWLFDRQRFNSLNKYLEKKA